ncbi:hypothetical protein MJH12_12360, partial [bacterium]|nr:hypothetical protein [bacterium]
SDKVESKIRWYESYIRKMIKESEIQGRKLILKVFSDHGMCNVKSNHNLMDEVEKLGLNSDLDYTVIYDSTMVRFWFHNDRARQIISEYLDSLQIGKTLSKSTLRKWSCYFPDQKFGELIFLMDPGRLICPSFMGNKTVKGMHGYHPEDKDSYASLCSNSILKVAVNSIVDIYSLIKSEVCA